MSIDCYHRNPPQIGQPPRETPCEGPYRSGPRGATGNTHKRVIGTRADGVNSSPDPTAPCAAGEFAASPNGCTLGLRPDAVGQTTSCRRCGQNCYVYSQRQPIS